MKNQCMGLINLEKKGNPNINILNYARPLASTPIAGRYRIIDFVLSFLKKKELYKSKEEAMSSAIEETFTSVIGSSLTTIAGFLVLCTMSLTLGKDLGIVMAKGVLIGLISTLLLFPALILTFDKYIEKTKHKKINLVF